MHSMEPVWWPLMHAAGYACAGLMLLGVVLWIVLQRRNGDDDGKVQ